MDPLSVLRQYNINNFEIIESDNKIIMGRFSFPKTVKTNYLIQGSGRNGRAKDYYSLECLLYYLKNHELFHPEYVKQAVAHNIPAVRYPDRIHLLQFLSGEIASCSSIEDNVPLDNDLKNSNRPEVSAMAMSEIDCGLEGALLASSLTRADNAERAKLSADGGSNAPNPTEAATSDSEALGNRPSCPRLSGAARKRFKRLMLMEMNIEVEEALILCRTPWKDIPQLISEAKARKRICTEDQEPPKDQQAKATKTTLDGRIKPTIKESEFSKVGIRGEHPLTEEQIKLVRRALLALIAKTNKGEGPKFNSFSENKPKPGWILVECENIDSRDWLLRVVSEIEPWPEAKISALGESELPKPAVVTSFFPDSDAETLDEAMRLLGVQNKGLNTELWKVIHSRKEKGGVFATFEVDDTSVETLKESQGEAAIGFKTIVFKINDGGAKDAQSKPITASYTNSR